MANCPRCGIVTFNTIEILHFKSNKTIKVCFKCSDWIRNENIQFKKKIKTMRRNKNGNLVKR